MEPKFTVGYDFTKSQNFDINIQNKLEKHRSDTNLQYIFHKIKKVIESIKNVFDSRIEKLERKEQKIIKHINNLALNKKLYPNLLIVGNQLAKELEKIRKALKAPDSNNLLEYQSKADLKARKTELENQIKYVEKKLKKIIVQQNLNQNDLFEKLAKVQAEIDVITPIASINKPVVVFDDPIVSISTPTTSTPTTENIDKEELERNLENWTRNKKSLLNDINQEMKNQDVASRNDNMKQLHLDLQFSEMMADLFQKEIHALEKNNN